VRQPPIVGERPRAAYGLRRAAAALGVVLGISPQLQGDREDLLAGARGEQRGDRRINPAAHRDERARPTPSKHSLLAGGGAERAMQGVRGELRRVALGGEQAAELRGDPIGSHACGLQQGRSLYERDGRAARRDRGPAAGGVETGIRDHTRGTGGVKRDREAHKIPAGSPAGGAGEGVLRRVPAPAGML
jgi:hypothetical protein